MIFTGEMSEGCWGMSGALFGGFYPGLIFGGNVQGTAVMITWVNTQTHRELLTSYILNCVLKNVPPYCDNNFIKSEPIFKILPLLESMLKFQQNSI